VDVRRWWDQIASERDQDAVLYHTQLDRDLAGVPWAFLPEEVQQVLTRRVSLDLEALKRAGRRLSTGGEGRPV
jgi:hypothetical protein